MFFRSALLLFSYAALSTALAPAPEITAAPAEPTAELDTISGLPYTITCQCQTIPYLTTTFCLPCSTVYATTNFNYTTAVTATTATTTGVDSSLADCLRETLQ
ncbi:hypothetical protein K438DRAFT_1960608 [Mycena galopus ATCC 62051]|nr:hypothetical protein K438DRAFT_1960608 [Mycena galopus ATCC 62051]